MGSENIVVRNPIQVPTKNGRIYHVDANFGKDGNEGYFNSPLASLDEAFERVGNFNASLAGSGNIIRVYPGTYETNVLFDGDLFDYTRLEAAFEARYGRPDIVPTTGLALSVKSQGVSIQGMRFANGGQDSDLARWEGNGGSMLDVVFDGDTAMGATKSLLKMWCNASDDSYTASENRFENIIFRGSPGYGLSYDCQHAAVGVLPTDNQLINAQFQDNTGIDMILLATAVSVADMKRHLWERCKFGMGGKNKATHIDLQTNKIGAANTSLFSNCDINDDTIDTTAVKIASTGISGCGGCSLDGVINWDALD